MRDTSPAFTTREKEEYLSPVELFHIWEGGDDPQARHWYYTSSDEAVDYNGNTYEPAAIKRSSLSFDSDLTATKCGITVGALEENFRDYLAQNPLAQMWVSVSRVHRGAASDAVVFFVGQVKTVAFQGAQAEAECVGFEHFLSMKIPRYHFQAHCNNTLYDAKCNVDRGAFSNTCAVTISGNILTAPEFATRADGFFTYGWVSFGGQKRMITAHSGSSIVLQYPFIDIADGDEVTASAGCDQRITTCRDKFDNLGGNNGLLSQSAPVSTPSKITGNQTLVTPTVYTSGPVTSVTANCKFVQWRDDYRYTARCYITVNGIDHLVDTVSGVREFDFTRTVTVAVSNERASVSARIEAENSTLSCQLQFLVQVMGGTCQGEGASGGGFFGTPYIPTENPSMMS